MQGEDTYVLTVSDEEAENYKKWLKVNIRLMMLSAPKNMLRKSVRS